MDEHDLRDQMHAERGPRINGVLLHVHVLDAIHNRRRARRRRSAKGVLAAAAVLAAASIAVPGHNLPSSVAGGLRTGMPTCGKVPQPSGPRSQSLDLTLTGPTTGQSGLRVSLTATFRSRSGAPADYNLGYDHVYVVRDGYIIGKYPDNGGYAGVGRGVYVAGREAQSVDDISVVLAGCPRGITDLMNPNHSRPPLPAGTYQLVVAIPDVVDSGQDSSLLVSAPMTIDVTAATGERAP